MKIFVCLAALAVTVTAIPQGYGSAGVKEPRCKKIWKTFTRIEYEEIKPVCHTKQIKKCDTKYRQKCTPYQDEICRPYSRQHCEDKREKHCSQKYRDISEPYYEDHCEDHYETVCEKTWKEVGYNDKVWVDDPSTCREVKKTDCKKVEKQRIKKEPYEDCQWITKPHCRQIKDKKCEYVTKQNCQRVPYDDCHFQPHEECSDHRKVPHEIPDRRQITVCEGDDDYDYDYDGGQSGNIGSVGNGGYSPLDVSGVFDVRQDEPTATLPRQADGTGGCKDCIIFGEN